MANIVPFAQAPVPAHIAKFQSDRGSNIDPRITINQLSFRGKVWRTVLDGVEKPMLNKDDEPISTVHVVVLAHNKARSRSYYEGNYEEGKSTPPVCSSLDGEVPDASIKNPKASACAACQFSKKGSKITANGKETTACSVSKMIAVVPLQDLSAPPMRLRMAQTSIWDGDNKDNEAKGFYAWDQYLDMLRKHGADHTAAVATKIKFDSRQAYPKLVFGASRWLEDEEVEAVDALCDSQSVKDLLAVPEAEAAKRADAATPVEDDEAQPAVLPGKPQKAAPVEDDDDADDAPPPPPKKAKAKVIDVEPEADDDDADDAPPPPPKKAKKAAPAPEADDDDADDAPPPPKKAKKAAPAPEAEEEEVPAPKGKKAAPAKGNGLADLVSDWDA